MSDRETQMVERLEQMPLSQRSTYRTAMGGKSRKAAIKAFCAECVGWEDVANQVRECTDLGCPLYTYRPHQSKRVGRCGDLPSECASEVRKISRRDETAENTSEPTQNEVDRDNVFERAFSEGE